MSRRNQLNRFSATHEDNQIGPVTRRECLQWIGGGLAALSLPVSLGRAESPTVKRKTGLLARPAGIQQLETRSKIVLELDGELQINEPDPQKEQAVRKGEVKGKSTLEYFEFAGFDGDKSIAARRQYTVAKTENWISGSASSVELRPECRKTVCLRNNGLWKQYCPGETLTANEVELTHSPINTTVLEYLLPKEPAKPNASWGVSGEDAAQLFNLGAVHDSTLTSKISKVDGGKATVSLAGEISGTANSVPTTLKIDGSYQVSMGSLSAMVSWVGIVIKENRNISEAEPGFSVTARIQLLRAESKGKVATSAESLKSLVAADNEGNWLIKLVSQTGRYSMLADRRWKTFIDGGEEAILRMVENNAVIAQCTIMRLTPLGEGQQLTLEALQAEIKNSIGEGFEQFLEAGEKVTSSQLRLLRVVAMGNREGIPIQWVYDHLSDDTGKRIALIYTMGGNVTDRFAASDEQMTSSFRFVESTEGDQPTLAPRLSDKSAPAAKR